jgi:hypothetical protein
MIEKANAGGPWLAAVGGLAYLKTNTASGFQTLNTGASKLGYAQVNIGAATVDASPAKSAIPENHSTEVELIINLGIDACLNLLRWFRHGAASAASVTVLALALALDHVADGARRIGIVLFHLGGGMRPDASCQRCWLRF